jgi:hypothetical protein
MTLFFASHKRKTKFYRFNSVILITMYMRYLCFFLMLIPGFRLLAQSVVKKPLSLQDYQYKKEASGGARIQSNGVSVYAEYGWIKDLQKTRLIQIEYQYFINYQQKRQKSQIQGGREFQYGVQNRFHAVRVSFGFKRTIADKADRKGVRLCFTGFLGVSLGLVKPYYLKLIQPGDNNGPPVIKEERYSEANATRFLSLDSIVEAAPVRFGLNQLEPVPGLHGKVALDFDWGMKDEFVKALEAGIMMDIYYKRIPVMVNNSNRFFQIGLFLAFHFGKRW